MTDQDVKAARTNEKSSDLINQAITNLPIGSWFLADKLWVCMKQATLVEITEYLNNKVHDDTFSTS